MIQAADEGRVAPHAVGKYLAQIAIVFAVQFAAGKLGNALAINSGGIGPVWPASGIALAALLLFGYQVWPGVVAGAFLLAFLSPIPHIAAAVYAAGTTLAALTGMFLLRRVVNFCTSLCRLRDALGLIVFGAFGSSLVSASIGVSLLYTTHVRGWSGFGSAWLIYWLGDSMGVLLVTPLVLTFPNLLRIRPRVRIAEFTALLLFVTVACFIVFGDLPLIPVRLHVLAFAVLPFVMWAAIRFGVSGSTLSTFFVATIATVATVLGSGPFAKNSPFTNAVLLDVFFAVLSVSGMTLAALIAEREEAEREREESIRSQAAMGARLRLATIVESSDDAIASGTRDGIIVSWNAGAQRMYGYTEAEVVGKPITILVPPELPDEENKILETVRAGGRIENFETVRVTKAGKRISVSLSISPIKDSSGAIVGLSGIARDITERKLAEAALANVSRKLIEAQEQERARIGRELHDDIGQRLALLAVELQQLHENSLILPDVRSRMGELQKQVLDVATDIQSLSHELHSAKLQYLGIAGAMRGFCQEFGKQQKVEIDFQTRDLPTPLSPDTSLCFFRVLQEALHNAAKHSGVRHFEVRLWGTSDEIHLTVKDSGAGFDREAAKKCRGLGLISMEERLKLLNGTMTIESQPKRGTTIHARVPLSSEGDSLRAAG
jgi:PAS domain S-box-containing protein